MTTTKNDRIKDITGTAVVVLIGGLGLLQALNFVDPDMLAVICPVAEPVEEPSEAKPPAEVEQ